MKKLPLILVSFLVSSIAFAEAQVKDNYLNLTTTPYATYNHDGTRYWNSLTISQLTNAGFVGSLGDAEGLDPISFAMVSTDGGITNENSGNATAYPALSWFDASSPAQTAFISMGQGGTLAFKLTGLAATDAVGVEWIASRSGSGLRLMDAKVNGRFSDPDGTAVTSDDFVTNQNPENYMRWNQVFPNHDGEVIFSAANVSLENRAAAVANAIKITITPNSERPLEPPSSYPFVHSFDDPSELDQFVVEQMPGGTVSIQDGQLVIDDSQGCTVWFREKLQAPYVIEYEVTASSQGRVSDINCFWNAIDPHTEAPLIDNTRGRTGSFRTYDDLRLYYVGMGGNNNSSTRFRRYPGDGTRTLLPEHDLTDTQYLLTPDQTYQIQIRSDGRHTQYLRDGKVIFDIVDEEPFTEGWFGFRTVDSHLLIDNLRITRPGDSVLNLMGAQSGFSYFNTSPESPDGSRIAFVTFQSQPDERSDDVQGALWVADTQGRNANKVISIAQLDNHNGAKQQWVDDETIAYTDGLNIFVVDVESGAVIAGPHPGVLGHDAHSGKILFAVHAGISTTREKGVYELDVATDQVRQILSYADLAAISYPNTNTATEELDIRHAQYSPDGSHIAIRVAPEGASEMRKFLLTCKPDGSDLVLFGPKPMHFLWWDENTMAGHDHQVADGQPDDRSARRWTRSGQFLETLAPPGNHLAFSPGRTFLSSESWYSSHPVELYLYVRGKDGSSGRQVISSEHSSMVWDKGLHINPAFSRDGRRLYFNLPTDYGGTQIAAVDLDLEELGLSDYQWEMVPGPAALLFRLSWESLPGTQYRIEHSSDLSSWQLDRVLTGTGDRTQTEISFNQEAKRNFVRVVMESSSY